MKRVRWVAIIALAGVGCSEADHDGLGKGRTHEDLQQSSARPFIEEPREREREETRLARYFIERPIKSFAEEQGRLCGELETAGDPATKARNAHILTELWRAGLLRNEIKDSLVDRYYKAVLFQFRGPYPGLHFVVRSHHTFPFPAVYTSFTPTLYVNDEAIWSPERPQTTHAMSNNNGMLTSLSGGFGKIKVGDVLHYSITMQQEVDREIVWEKTILTDKIAVQDFRD